MKLEKLNKQVHVLTNSELGTVFGGGKTGEGTFIKSKTPKTYINPDGTQRKVVVVVWRDYSSDDGDCYSWANDWHTSEYDA
jgi:hypothetical protein